MWWQSETRARIFQAHVRGEITAVDAQALNILLDQIEALPETSASDDR